MLRAIAAVVLFASSAAGPLDVTRAFYRALHAGDAAAAARLAAGDAKPSLASFVRLARAHRDLEAAIARRFGKGEAGHVGYGNRVQNEVKALLGAGEEIEGDAARVTTLDGRTLATLRRSGASWKVELDEALSSREGRARLAREAEAAEAASRQVVAAIRAGRHPDAGAAARDFAARVSRATGAPAPAGEEGVAL